ncbi:DNA cytosine methyltransferase [Vogesella sp. EB]|uniref:DNA cytosine methyltransferase n=1 Tax=Vogesella sp. EB TaxID=1526735 RepID=UPI0009E6409A|nr:DNA cytosine methyltransferase [Vogesella sp. EB]
MEALLKKLEAELAPVAERFSIHHEEIIALTNQWIHSYIYGAGFSAVDDVTADFLIRPVIDDFLNEHQISNISDLISNVSPFMPAGKSNFKFIDLFAGIGGFRLALQELGGICVFGSEWDKSAKSTYQQNYGELPFGDITKFTADDISDSKLDLLIPDHDILTAGFPCQPFSHAGVSARSAIGKDHGFKCETQGTLFFDVVRIAQVKRPKFLFLENVRNIERHDEGRTFDVIKRAIAEIGYNFHYALIDSSTLVPQRRIRCYMVCVRNDMNCDFKFPEFLGESLPLQSILESDVPDTYTISDKLWEGHINRTRRNLERGTGFTAFLADLSRPANTLVARYGKDGKECLIPQDGKNPRMLTPRECARLQGYPENFILPKSRTPAYKQFGNSVSVPVIRKIAKSIIENL